MQETKDRFNNLRNSNIENFNTRDSAISIGARLEKGVFREKSG